MPNSITSIYCPSSCCGAATCDDFNQSPTELQCEPGEQLVNNIYTDGDVAPNGKVVVGDDLTCYSCEGEPDTCVIDESSWYPDPYYVCEETFTQYGYGYDSITGEYCERTREAQGMGEPYWSEWYPYEWEQCDGVQFTQYRYDYVCNGYEEQQAVGTGGEVTWGEWEPNTDTYCEGVSFTQYRYGINCNAYEQRNAVGTLPITWGEWEPSTNTRCTNQTFTQSRSSNCGTYEYRQVNGTKAVVWSEWSPAADTICEGVPFFQSRYATNNCPGYESRTGTGTKATVWGDWTPSPETVCEGETFQQTRTNSTPECEGSQSRDAVGTRDCSSLISGTFSSSLDSCETKSSIETVTNSFSVNALLTASGGVDDDLLINGQVYEAGKYPFNWSSYGSPCGSSDSTNGAHNWSYATVLAPGASIQFGAKDNGFGGGINGSWSLTPITK